MAAIIAGRDDEFHRWMGPGSNEPAPTACIVVAGDVVGWVDYDPGPAWLQPGEVNVGYVVFPGHRGLGYATRALALLVRHLTVETPYRTAVLVIDHGNERSLAVAERLGFTRTAGDFTLTENGEGQVRYEVDIRPDAVVVDAEVVEYAPDGGI